LRTFLVAFFLLLPSHQRNSHIKPRISVAAIRAATLILHWEGSIVRLDFGFTTKPCSDFG
jgi:hypothetical protein